MESISFTVTKFHIVSDAKIQSNCQYNREAPQKWNNGIVAMGSDTTGLIGSKKAMGRGDRAGTMDEMNSSGGDFSFQNHLFEVLERKTSHASFLIDDSKPTLDVWKADIVS